MNVTKVQMKRTGGHNSGLTVEEIKRSMRHYTRAEKAAERKRRAAQAAAPAMEAPSHE